MIKIEYNSQNVKITGHAGYDQPGKDIVCAAVSCLWYTLLEKLEKERKNGIVDFSYNEEPGYAEICIEWVNRVYGGYVETCMDTVITGWKLLGQQYPENISIKKV